MTQPLRISDLFWHALVGARSPRPCYVQGVTIWKNCWDAIKAGWVTQPLRISDLFWHALVGARSPRPCYVQGVTIWKNCWDAIGPIPIALGYR